VKSEKLAGVRPLAGTLVVALEQAVSAPFATRQLADLGARVIKIERPGDGDFARHYDPSVRGMASYFVWLNRSKESLTLDVKHPAAAAVLDRLLARADVFVQNLAPGAADRLGLGWASLHERYPRLVACDISGYGDSGPAAAKKAYDLLIQSEAGLLAITGTPEQPSKVGISVADIAAGMYAYSGVLAALIQRGRTGTGSRVEVSMLEALGEWMSHAVYYTRYGGQTLPRTGARHATIAPYGPFTCGDGQAVYLGIQNEREWARFCELVLQQPALAADERFASNRARVRHRDDLERTILDLFGAHPSSEMLARLDRAGIATARLNGVADFAAHPQLEARHRWREVGSPVGPLAALAPPGLPDDVEPRMDPVPALGEHTDRVLAELGFDAAAIAAWRDAGAI
jgi:crotonobetainyl-CoA:carnitine CoA-transferase CaiB-like acyl-CoA transferase